MTEKTVRIKIYHGWTMVLSRTKPAKNALNTAENQEKLVTMFQKAR